MTIDRPTEYLLSLLSDLCNLPSETEWVGLSITTKTLTESFAMVSMMTTTEQTPLGYYQARPKSSTAGRIAPG